MKAEERALEKYPLMSEDDKEGLEALKYIGMECDCASEYNDVQEAKKAYFIEGYHQAEKDLELTWEDIETIGELRLNVALELRRKELESSIKAPLKFTTEDICKEVLKRFKEMKER
jgi:hypothetical protein